MEKSTNFIMEKSTNYIICEKKSSDDRMRTVIKRDIPATCMSLSRILLRGKRRNNDENHPILMLTGRDNLQK